MSLKKDAAFVAAVANETRRQIDALRQPEICAVCKEEFDRDSKVTRYSYGGFSNIQEWIHADHLAEVEYDAQGKVIKSD